MAVVIGVTLAAAVAVFARAIGFDRERSFYPVVLIVIGCLYLLFAVMGQSREALVAEAVPAILFVAAAGIGFRTTPWIVVAGLAGHGVFDFFHPALIDNPGVPPWWPDFCGAYDVTAAACMAILIVSRKAPKKADVPSSRGADLKVGLYLVVMVLGAGLVVRAQESIVRPKVAFAVASIKPNPVTNGFMTLAVPDQGSVAAVRYPTLWLIGRAFGLVNVAHEIKGTPEWLMNERFDIRALPPDDAPRDQIPLMLQSLLIDRFKLRAHWETRDLPIYSLELARRDGTLGPDLQPSKHDCAAFWAGGGKGYEDDAPRDEQGRAICLNTLGLAGRQTMGGVPWSELFTRISVLAQGPGGLDRQVVDNTGLSGHFAMHLEFAPLGLRAAVGAEFKQPAIKEAVQEQLGLKFVPKTAPWKVLVIDSIERPTPD